MVKSAIATLWIQDCPNGSKWCLASTIIAGGFSCHMLWPKNGRGWISMNHTLGPWHHPQLASAGLEVGFQQPLFRVWSYVHVLWMRWKFPVTSKACVHNASTNAPEAMLSRFLAARTLWILWAVRDSMWWGWRWVDGLPHGWLLWQAGSWSFKSWRCWSPTRPKTCSLETIMRTFDHLSLTRSK